MHEAFLKSLNKTGAVLDAALVRTREVWHDYQITKSPALTLNLFYSPTISELSRSLTVLLAECEVAVGRELNRSSVRLCSGLALPLATGANATGASVKCTNGHVGLMLISIHTYPHS